MAGDQREIGVFRGFIAAIGAAFIFFLIRLFGRKVKESDAPWIVGPYGGDYIGDSPYEECAEREGLTVERRAAEGGLIPDMAALEGDAFDVTKVHPEVRRFYEHTAEYRMDVWAESYFPASVALWLLVTTISRKVNQLNFPLSVLDTARGMDSEIVLLRDADEHVKYAGWYRRLSGSGLVIYTGFYMTEVVPHTGRACVKVVFPMPEGNATVILEPSVTPTGDFELSSGGRAFGDAGFYRITRLEDAALRVWRIRTLTEHFRVYVDDTNTLRCDHRVKFLGFPVLHLHYRIERAKRR